MPDPTVPTQVNYVVSSLFQNSLTSWLRINNYVAAWGLFLSNFAFIVFNIDVDPNITAKIVLPTEDYISESSEETRVQMWGPEWSEKVYSKLQFGICTIICFMVIRTTSLVVGELLKASSIKQEFNC